MSQVMMSQVEQFYQKRRRKALLYYFIFLIVLAFVFALIHSLVGYVPLLFNASIHSFQDFIQISISFWTTYVYLVICFVPIIFLVGLLAAYRQYSIYGEGLLDRYMANPYVVTKNNYHY